MTQAYWADLAAPAFRALPRDTIAVLPLGATEQHGPHLPLSVDRDLTDGVITAMWPNLTPRQSVLVLPTVAIGKSDEHMGFPGTLSLGATTLLAVLGDIMDGIARAGVTRVLCLNGHGGNTAILEIAVRAARVDHGLVAAHASWFAFAGDLSGFADVAHDLHAGEIETSAMLALRPDRVNMDLAQDFTAGMAAWEAANHLTGLTGQAARPGWVIEDLNPDGACGDASAATARKGARLIETAGQELARYLADFATFDLPGRAR
ncbi:creatininase family protein [Sulfitobacter sabulilitoris]|uniref:Creatininase family protein n=1 Tax=Sulfitobacter sabulilitoris TaxID=2562655 RepID=A0A5S3PFW5_9RHOB|nr:creatininase family protein [Sulfitobacter sabulilitoris]TMM52928.1 creatininase family protein [Sulfitobacter sabulilitoris]